VTPYTVLSGVGLAAAALAGLIVGSFLNVVAHRLPRGESLAFPGSHCPSCRAPIAAYDNVPVLSWIVLRGRCRACRARIALRYPALELANAVLWTAVFRLAPTWWDFATGIFLCSAGLALLAIDAEFQILPDLITLPGIAVGLVLAIGSVRRTLGMIGALLGPAGVLVTVLAASLSGSVVGIALMIARGADGKMRLPFGVFLAIGAIGTWFFGDPLVARYRALWP